MEESSVIDNTQPLEPKDSKLTWLRNNIKFILPSAFVALLLFFIGLSLFSKQSNKKLIAVKGIGDTANQVAGYIVEYKDAPISSLARANTSFYTTRTQANKSLLTLLNKNSFTFDNKDQNNIKINAQFSHVINGISLDLTKEEAEKLKESPYVKAVYEDRVVHTNLYESVPLIGANRVWDLTDQANVNITGKGVRVAILDTGVDYTHRDLGQTPIQERPLEKVTSKKLKNEYWSYVDHTISFNNNRLLYPIDNDVVGIYSFKDKKTIKVNLSTPISKPEIDRLFLEGQKIIYMSSGTTKLGLFIKDLTTNKTTQISDMGQRDGGHLATAGSVDYADGNVIYSSRTGKRDAKGRLLYNIYSYDVSSKKQTKLLDNTTSLPIVKVSGKTLIYSIFISPNKGYRIFSIDLNTNKRKLLSIPHAGQLVDFKGDNILYTSGAELGKRSYYLYNLVAKNIQEIKYPSDETYAPNKYYKSASYQWSEFIEPDYPEGFIGDNVVFFETTTISDNGRLAAYDLNTKKYSKLNVILPSSTVTGAGNRICFISPGDFNIYCHVYDASYNYALPTEIFNSKIVGGYNFINLTNDPMDDMGHGTHVAGIVAGNGALKGVAPGAEIVSYKVLDYSGYGRTSGILGGIDAAIGTRLDDDPNNDISVISMSLGQTCDRYNASCGPDDVLSKAIDRATANGITSAISSGNDGQGNATVGSPGVARTAITVGATNKKKQEAGFSSRGYVTVGTESYYKPDILAPGVDICSAQLGGYAWPDQKRCFSKGHVFLSGTSMAAPHIAGTIALIKQAHPDWTPAEIKDEIITKSDNSVYPAEVPGKFFVNVAKIFSLTPSPTMTLTPTPTNISGSTVVKTTKTVDFQAIADSYVRGDQLTSNFGKTATLIADGDPLRNSYLKFNLSSLKGKTLVKATLQVQVAPGSESESLLSKGLQVNLVKDTSWTETGLNYKNKPKNDKLLGTLKGAKISGDIISLEVTTGVSGRLGSLVTFSISNLGTDGIVFNSREATVGRPKLTVEYK